MKDGRIRRGRWRYFLPSSKMRCFSFKSSVHFSTDNDKIWKHGKWWKSTGPKRTASPLSGQPYLQGRPHPPSFQLSNQAARPRLTWGLRRPTGAANCGNRLIAPFFSKGGRPGDRRPSGDREADWCRLPLCPPPFWGTVDGGGMPRINKMC